MDWQVIILTLGASLITGIISIIGNIIISKSSVKSALIQNEIQNKREFIEKREKAYNEILACINIQMEEIKDIEKPYDEQKMKINEVWRANYHYCSKAVNKEMYWIARCFDKTTPTKLRLDTLVDLMKKDIDKFYGIKERTPKNN